MADIEFTNDEIRDKYEKMASRFDLCEWPAEVLGLRRLRRQLFGTARGRVLEVAIGTGRNLAFHPADCALTGGDLSPAMLAVAAKTARRLGRAVDLRVTDAERLDFPDGAFDTVASSCSLCTFPDPVGALREMSRVCRPDGRILLLEHGRSDRGWLGRWQDRRAEKHAALLGCIWNREPLEIVGKAGLIVRQAHRTFFGIFHTIEAAPRRG